MRILLVLACLVITLSASSQQEQGECNYYAKISKSQFCNFKDSISNILFASSDSVIVCGINSFSESGFAIYTYSKGEQTFYKFKISADTVLFTSEAPPNSISFLDLFSLNKLTLAKKLKLKPSRQSHDFGMTITFLSKQKSIDYFVCYGQVAEQKSRPLGKMFIEMLKMFNYVFK